MDYQGRISRLRVALGEHDAGGLLITNLTNVGYLTGFSGTNAQVLITGGGVWFFTDPRYAARAADLVQGADVVIYRERLTDELPERLAAESVTRLGIEADAVTLGERGRLEERLGDLELVPMAGAVEVLRRVKDADEVALIRAAVDIGDHAFTWVLDRLRPGVAERDIALDLEVHMRRAGADAVSFEPIVGSGPLSAHIHHTASERQFEQGDLVLLDFGCKVDGYCSDLTRTVVLGPSTGEQRELYDTVLRAQERGIAAATAGTSGVDADAAARAVIEQAGHGDLFAHGLGHGVGLDIHEAPRLHRISEDELRENEVVTVEPGVYVEGAGGIRIEDCVLVKHGESVVLGSAPKDKLIEV